MAALAGAMWAAVAGVTSLTGMMVLATALVFVAGLAIGATSIGGVLVVPVLTGLGGIEPRAAVAAASFGFGFAGVAAFAGRGALPAGAPRLGTAGLGCALLGAALGAGSLAWLPAGLVARVVGVVALASGAFALLGVTAQRRRVPGAGGMALLGLAVGCVSAWSGTGGPVVLLPLLALLGWPVEAAVGSAQRVQLPVAVAASGVHLAAGRLDLGLGAGIGLLVLAGWLGGRWLAARLPVAALRQAVGVALVGTGLAFLR